MNNIAQTRSTRFESILSATYLLPGMLAVNTAALLAVDHLGGIPQWLKAAAALFLAF